MGRLVESTQAVTQDLTAPIGLGHKVAGYLSLIDWTTVSSIPLAAVGASKRLPSDVYLISTMLYGQLPTHTKWSRIGQLTEGVNS